MDDKDFIDVDYIESGQEETIETDKRIINGEPLFYTTTQVSQILNVEPSTIRFWTKRFEHLLDIEISNKNRKYKKSDIEKLKFIKKLAKEDGLSLQQIDEYTSAKGFDINSIEKEALDRNNPIAIQAFISAATIEMDKKLNKFSEELITSIDNKLKSYFTMQNQINEKVMQDVAITVDEIVSEKVSTFENYIKENQEKTLKTLKDQKENLHNFATQFNDMVEDQKEFQKKQQEEFNNAIQEFVRTTTRMEKRNQAKENSLWNRLFGKNKY